MEINLDVSEVIVKVDEANGIVGLTDVDDGERVLIQEYDIPILVEFLSRFL